MDYISVADLRIPVVNTAEMREVDRLMIEKYDIQLLQMMENAGRNLAELARRFLDRSVSGKHIIIASGKGNNGGGGLVAARHLYNWGAQITVLIQTDALLGVPEIQWNILKKLSLEKKIDEKAIEFLTNDHGDLILDAMIGYGLSGNPRGWVAKMIQKINSLSVPVLALDVPSGLDATTGEIYDPCVQATATITLALPKTGLVKPDVDPESKTETFAALKLEIANWRWQGVPFYLCTGKRLAKRLTQIVVNFRPPPVSLFQPFDPSSTVQPNVLVMTIQPDEGFDLHFQVKSIGQPIKLSTQRLHFRYSEAFGSIPDAYETLILDILLGDQTLFVHGNWTEKSWELYTHLFEKDIPVHPYPAGTWGPPEADQLLARVENRWQELGQK